MTVCSLLRPGPGRVLLRCRAPDGALQVVGFVRRRRVVEVWRTEDERSAPPSRVKTLPGELEPLQVAGWLAAGHGGAALEPAQAADAVVQGLEEEWEAIVLNAWTRDLARTDPALHAVLTLDPEVLEGIEERCGELLANDVAELGSTLLGANRKWLAAWRSAVDEEVGRRVALEGAAGDAARIAAVREFVEGCVLSLGRLPRADEREDAWDGKGVRLGALSDARRRKLGLAFTGRVRRYRVWCGFRSAAETFGSDLPPGPGWYWRVLNPHPGWISNDVQGPYTTEDDAWEEASYVGQED